MKNHEKIPGWFSDDGCPEHGCPAKKTYTLGSTMSAETDVTVFNGCWCAVAVRHDPVGTYPSEASYYVSYNEAAGVGRFHAAMAAAKYR